MSFLEKEKAGFLVFVIHLVKEILGLNNHSFCQKKKNKAKIGNTSF